MIFFTSDLHIDHKNIIKHSNRPFESVEEMNKALIDNWNRVVGQRDTIYVLGDFSFGRPEEAVMTLRHLSGTKFLIEGNHDKGCVKFKPFRDQFAGVRQLHEINVPDVDAHLGQQKIVMCHYAMRVWNKSHYGSWQLYGHSHGSLKDDPNSLSTDVGVDNTNYSPISYDQVKAIMKTKTWKPIDHHDGKRE